MKERNALADSGTLHFFVGHNTCCFLNILRVSGSLYVCACVCDEIKIPSFCVALCGDRGWQFGSWDRQSHDNDSRCGNGWLTGRITF